jgi:hypothetical protein
LVPVVILVEGLKNISYLNFGDHGHMMRYLYQIRTRDILLEVARNFWSEKFLS